MTAPDVARPINRAIASALGVLSSAAAIVKFAGEAVETWLDHRGEVFDARADIDDPELVDALDEDEEF